MDGFNETYEEYCERFDREVALAEAAALEKWLLFPYRYGRKPSL